MPDDQLATHRNSTRGAAAAPQGRGRREGERLLAYWDEKLIEFGGGVTLSALDLADIDNRDWSNRFLIAVDPVIERSSLAMYGGEFARLLELPANPRTDLPLPRQLPPRYISVFLQGCAQAQQYWEPMRLEGEVTREDGRVEQYRAVFIPVGVRPNALTCFAFGAFSSRIVDAPARVA